MKSLESILVVDDSTDTLEVLRRNLMDFGYRVITVVDVPQAIQILSDETIDLVITDFRMPQVSGMELIRHIRENHKLTEVMMITGYATVEGAVEALKCGAEEYLTKPFTSEELLEAVERVLEKVRMHRSQELVPVLRTLSVPGIIGESDVMRKIFGEIKKAAQTPATVLIAGESGTGKELVARAIHYGSSRATAPFVPVHCGSIPEGLLESELFGHLKGSFTGATESRAGFFQTAEGGTVFLDEISETSAAMQVKLLRVLQEHEICMIGTSRSRKIDIRIMAASNKDLQMLVKKNMFRDDLFFRLNVISIEVPPLRVRGDDVFLLARHFSEKFSKEFELEPPLFPDQTLRAMKNYSWPGNVRELENLVQRMVVMSSGGEIHVTDLPSPMRFSAPRISDLNKTLEQVEAEHLRKVLAGTMGNKTRAAQILGIDRKTLREKLKRHKMPTE